MRVVIYDQETYEPLTVVTVPQDFVRGMEIGEKPRIYSLAVPPTKVLMFDPNEPLKDTMKIVNVEFEPLAKGSKIVMWLCTAKDAESALLLRSTFLPGQQRRVNEIEKQAFFTGMFAALA